MSETLPGYDRWKLDNGEPQRRSFVEYEPPEEIELPLTCQSCGAEYMWKEKGATLGYCPRCNSK